jgi:hypothetical protein
MRLTVGSLPASVYWRRRAVVLGVLLLAVIILWTSCSGPAKPDATKNLGVNTPASPDPQPSTNSSILTPTVGGSASGSAAPTSLVPPVSSVDPAGTAAPLTQCTDTDLLLTAVPETALAPNGAYIKLYLKIKNTSGRPCTRNLGADHQELYLQAGTTKAWSSDVCQPVHGSETVTMQPNIEHSYSVTWNGLASDAGCTSRKPPGIGKYELFARLDTKISAPASVQLT